MFVCFAFRRARGLLSLSFPSSASGLRSPRRALFLCTSLSMQNRSLGGKEIIFFPLNSACSAEAAVGCHSQDGPKPPPFLPFPPPPPWYRRGHLGMSSKRNSPKSSEFRWKLVTFLISCQGEKEADLTLAGILRTSVSTTTTAIPMSIARSPNTVMHHFNVMAPTSAIPSPPDFFPSFQ